MRKTLLSIFVLTTLSLSAQNVTIPDANFKAYLIGETSINTNGDSEIQVSEANAFSGQIYCPSQSITDLTGIEAFTSLDRLVCVGNPITTIDVSNNLALTDLNCGSTSISSLDVSLNISLITLVCDNNSISTLDISQNTNLEYLQCGGNQISALDITNAPQLLSFRADNNSLITGVDFSQCPLLYYLDVEYTGLSSINISNNPLIEVLQVGYCSLTTLDVTSNTALQLVECQSNQLTDLDFSLQSVLFSVDCSNNQLTSLNLQNGNNTAMSNGNLFAAGNIDLTCIQVDDTLYSASTWTNVGVASFNLDCSSAGVQEMKLSIGAYPNPTTGKVVFESETQIELIELYSLDGEKMLVVNNSNSIDISQLSDAIYIVKVTSNNKVGVVKLIKGFIN